MLNVQMQCPFVEYKLLNDAKNTQMKKQSLDENIDSQRIKTIIFWVIWAFRNEPHIDLALSNWNSCIYHV